MKYLLYICVGIAVSFYIFSFGITGLPESVNTKMILAVIGLPLTAINLIKSKSLIINYQLLITVVIAVLFSIVGFVSVDINNTSDYSYANYFISFFVWLFAAYTVFVIIKLVHGRFDLIILCYYLTAVCVAQCVFALFIDVSDSFQEFVDSYVIQGQQFLNEVNRLYGIGASLDNAGVRFSVTLILIMSVLTKEEEVYNNIIRSLLLIIGFFIIIGVGNMISRTTLLGSIMGLIILVWNTGSGVGEYFSRYRRIYLMFFGVLIAIVMISMFFYHTDSNYRMHFRFAFEGFFNWFEKGKWYTASTDKLNRNMWIWPDSQDFKAWVIGTGLFENWYYGTDIGYCRFVLYNGLVGFLFFLALFIYLPFSFMNKFPKHRMMFLGLFGLTLLVWIKVSTDIFFIYALFFQLIYTNERAKKFINENYL